MFAQKLLIFPRDPVIKTPRSLPLEHFIQHFSVLCVGLIMATLIFSLDILYRPNNNSSVVVTHSQDKGTNTEDDEDTIAVDEEHEHMEVNMVEQTTTEDQNKVMKGTTMQENKEEYLNQSEYERSENIETDNFHSI